VKRLLTVLLFAATSAIAQAPPLTITSVTPASGPAAGGTEVTIKGTGFQFCVICSPPLPPPEVSFGGVYVRNVQVIDENTMVVTTPAHLPSIVNVNVEQFSKTATLPGAYTFTGPVSEGFDRILLPIFLRPIEGQFGSLFSTRLRLANSSSIEPTFIFGLTPFCALAACIPFDPMAGPMTIPPGQILDSFEYTGNPGAFIYVPKDSPELVANMRVFDLGRNQFNYGTEIQVVRDDEFTLEPIRLLGVPGSPQFRNTLRIYAEAETSVTVTIDDMAWHVPLRPGVNLLDPAYAQFTDFPVGNFDFDVWIIPSTVVPPFPGLTAPRVWAFISVTNNETQLITTISPQ
jgi:IPT/TIG domain